MSKRAFLVIFLFLSLIFVPKVFSAEEPANTEQTFATSYDVVYDIGEDGVTTVTEKINLRNLTSEYYANQFKLIIGATQISDIKASDGGGELEVQSEQKDTSTIITVKFNQQVVGKDKILAWTLQFKSRDFAEKIGKVWEVRAPKISSSSNLENYNLTISVPGKFGEPTLISPTPKKQTNSNGLMFLTFEKDQLLLSGVSASFGTIQLFDFDLAYHLDNGNFVPILTNITLPPDTSYQDVIFQRIEPQPLNVTVDDDGNYLAWYKLTRGQKLDVHLVGSAKLYTSSKVKNPTLDVSLRQKYTSSDKYWEKDNPQIQSKLTEIIGPATESSSEKVKLIYQYVVTALKYNKERINDNIERFGAVTALNNPTDAVCMEFTDLFIALARAAGIPARELDGFAYTQNSILRPLSLNERGSSLNKDILHAWPEYWDDKRGWVMVDPTWENTTGGVDYFNKLDLSHFVFTIKGSSSQSPIPAGSYKYLGVDSQDVKVTLSETDFLGKPQLDVNIENPTPFWAGFPGKIKVKVSNAGNGVYPSNNFAVSSDKLIILGGETQVLGPVPAFGSAEFELNIRTTRQPFGIKSLFDKFNDSVVVLIGSQKFTKEVVVKPFLIFQTVPLLAIGLTSSIGLIYLAVLVGHFYQKRDKKKK